MTAASRSLATALWRARFASGLLRPTYTTKWDTTQRQICAGDSSRLCSEFAQDREGMLACFGRKTDMLSASCRHALSV